MSNKTTENITPENFQNLGSKIKKLRELRNYTQEYMANKLEMSQTSYSNIERNETELSMSKIFKIAQVLGVKPNDILEFDVLKMLSSNHNKDDKGHDKGNLYFERERKLYEDIIHKQTQEIQFLRSLLQDK